MAMTTVVQSITFNYNIRYLIELRGEITLADLSNLMTFN